VSLPSSTGRPPSPLSPARLTRPLSWLGQHDHSHVHLRLSMSQMSTTAAGHPASWSLGPSLMSALHRSRSVGAARLYLTFTSASTTASELHTCTTQAKRHVAHIAFAMVGLVTTQPTLWITLTITHHKTNTYEYLLTLCSQLHAHNKGYFYHNQMHWDISVSYLYNANKGTDFIHGSVH
jgi:hypothetical protein